MKQEQLPLSGIYFKLAVLHAMEELKNGFPDYKKVPPPDTAKDIKQKITKSKKTK